MGATTSSIEAIHYEAVVYNSAFDYAHDNGSYHKFIYIQSKRIIISMNMTGKMLNIRYITDKETPEGYEKYLNDNKTVRNKRVITLNDTIISKIIKYIESKTILDTLADDISQGISQEEQVITQ